MKEIAKKFYWQEMHLRQLGFTYNACGSFTKKKELKNLKNIFIKTN